MRIVKRLDIFILKQFCLLFAGTFFISLFIFLMQTIWLYMDDLIGKGLSVWVLAKFAFYASMTLVAVALPLAILLASLISFGNLGERLELLAMKAAGIPLVRILLPVVCFVVLLACGSFYFQNVIGPESSKRLYALIYSMRQKSPELEIPEGVFYNNIPGYNLFVEHKDVESGMLYGIMIYTQGQGYDNTQIVLADSGRLQSTADQMYLRLTLYDGERFRNMQNTGSAMDRATVPYMRETFKEEVDLIPFDSRFAEMDASLFNGNARTKGLDKLAWGIDSLRHIIDSVGQSNYERYQYDFLRKSPRRYRGEEREIADQSLLAKARDKGAEDATIPFDTLYESLSPELRNRAMRIASDRARSGLQQVGFYTEESNYMNHQLRIHELEWHKKYSLTLACLIFFFIGAPLGAIIRKGGLGVPVVVSVIIFIFYYMVNILGEKLARTGDWSITFGAWLSTMVLAPIGAWLTYKANQDSVVFNAEGYRIFFRRLLGLRISRHISRKEVIINDPDYGRMEVELKALQDDCATYNRHHHLRFMPSYINIFFRYEEDRVVIDISERLDAIVDELANSRDNYLLAMLNDIPVLVPDAHTRPFDAPRLNRAAGIFFPVGVFFWFRIWRYRLRLWYDLQQLQKQTDLIVDRINKRKE
ncbi:MAG: LptF/LptG family permease [Bacteroidaceae bacterium]|nr:LptF/LptG family permease [Bacteroidaceae bacterium]